MHHRSHDKGREGGLHPWGRGVCVQGGGLHPEGFCIRVADPSPELGKRAVRILECFVFAKFVFSVCMLFLDLTHNRRLQYIIFSSFLFLLRVRRLVVMQNKTVDADSGFRYQSLHHL